MIRSIAAKLADYLSLALTLSLGLLVAATGMVGHLDEEYTFSKTCAADWCENGRQNDFLKREWHEMVDEQLAALGCDKDKRLSPRVAVVNQQTDVADQMEGKWRHDKAVVRIVSFDEAWRAGTHHEVNVVGWCG